MTFLVRLAAHFPLPLLHALGVALGWAVHLLSARTRRHLNANLAQAGYADAALRRAAIAEAGKALLELPWIWLRSREEVLARVAESGGWKLVERARAGGRGVILLTPHLGAWEVAGQYCSRSDPLTVLYSPPKLKAIEPLMQAGRDRGGMKSVSPDLSGVRTMLRAMKNGEAIGILPDQVPGTGDGVWTEFFGRPAYTMTLVSRIAESTGAPVILTYAERLAGGRGYTMHFEALPQALPGETPLRCMNRALEALIRRCPAQYLWAYNRYKRPAGAEPPPTAGPAC